MNRTTLALIFLALVTHAPFSYADKQTVDCTLALQQLKKGSASIEEYKKSAEICPANASIRYNLALLQAEAGSKEESLASLEEAITRENRPQFHVARGRVLQDLKRLKEAREEYRNALSLNPDSDEARQGLYSLGEETIPSSKESAAERADSNSEASYAGALLLFKEGKFEASISELEKVLLDEPKHPQAFLTLGDAYRKLGNFSESEKALLRAREVDPENGHVDALLAEVQQKQKKLIDAEASYKSSLNKERDTVVLQNLGLIQLELKKYADAEVTLIEASKLDKGKASILNALGWAQLNQEKLYDAETSFRNALTLDPQNALAQNNLGIAYFKRGKEKEAKSAFEKALYLDSSLLDAKKNLEQVNKNLSNKQK